MTGFKTAHAAVLVALMQVSGCQAPVVQMTAPQGYTTRPIYCVQAPIGYVVSQDKWDPYLVPCPPQQVPAFSPPGGGGGGTGGGPTPPPSPKPTKADLETDVNGNTAVNNSEGLYTENKGGKNPATVSFAP